MSNSDDLIELERLEHADELPESPVALCSLCEEEPRDVREWCLSCWREHVATNADLAYERAQEDADGWDGDA